MTLLKSLFYTFALLWSLFLGSSLLEASCIDAFIRDQALGKSQRTTEETRITSRPDEKMRSEKRRNHPSEGGPVDQNLRRAVDLLGKYDIDYLLMSIEAEAYPEFDLAPITMFLKAAQQDPNGSFEYAWSPSSKIEPFSSDFYLSMIRGLSEENFQRMTDLNFSFALDDPSMDPLGGRLPGQPIDLYDHGVFYLVIPTQVALERFGWRLQFLAYEVLNEDSGYHYVELERSKIISSDREIDLSQLKKYLELWTDVKRQNAFKEQNQTPLSMLNSNRISSLHFLNEPRVLYAYTSGLVYADMPFNVLDMEFPVIFPEQQLPGSLEDYRIYAQDINWHRRHISELAPFRLLNIGNQLNRDQSQ